jgi:tetratricopeptide (TPR) repeat protein
MRVMRPILLAAVWLCGFSISFDWAAPAQEELAQLYAEARRAEQAGDLASAVESYRRIVALEPRMAEAYANLGRLHFQLGQFDQAETALTRAIELKPVLAGPYFFLGVLSFQRRQYPSALKQLKQSERLDPQNLLVHLYLGYAHSAARDFNEAVLQFEKAGALAPRDQDVFYHLSKTYGQLAESYFERLHRSFPDSGYTSLAKAHVFEADHEWEAAKREYGRAVARLPNQKGLKERLAWVTERAAGKDPGQPAVPPDDDSTIGSLRFLYSPPSGDKIKEEIKAGQTRARVWRSRPRTTAEKCYALADGYKALSFLAASWVAESNPNSYREHQLKGESYEAIGDVDQATREYERAIEVNPELQGVRFAIGNLFWKKNDVEKALPLLLGELKLNPNHAEALYEVGDIYLAQETPAKAREYFERSLESDPAIVEAHLALEKITTAAGEHQTSIEHLFKAAALAPEDPTPHYRLSTLYKKLGRSDEARREMSLFMTLKARQDKVKENSIEKKKRTK